MALPDPPDDITGDDEEPPDFSAWDTPEEVMRGGPIRERLLDVIVQLRDPTTVSTVADRADCDTETAREYLAWFADMGMVREIEGRPIQYERNESYLRWRRIEQIRADYSESEIVEALTETLDRIADYESQFDGEHPGAVSLLDASEEMSVEEAWRALSDWKTLERRAALLDAARQDDVRSGGRIRSVDV